MQSAGAVPGIGAICHFLLRYQSCKKKGKKRTQSGALMNTLLEGELS